VFTGCKAADALLFDLRNTPHAFVLGCLMDRRIDAARAWAIPHKISELRGGFSMEKLKKPGLEQWTETFKKHKLHTLPAIMAEIFYFAVRDINAKYGGDAAEIWRGTPSSATVVYRFLEFKGAGVKIATMAANILMRKFHVPFADLHSIDISPDTHVKRVMQRMGLVSKDVTKSKALIMIMYKARELNPEYPGIFDYACWKIGKDICHPTNPACAACPVHTECEFALHAKKSQTM